MKMDRGVEANGGGRVMVRVADRPGYKSAEHTAADKALNKAMAAARRRRESRSQRAYEAHRRRMRDIDDDFLIDEAKAKAAYKKAEEAAFESPENGK